MIILYLLVGLIVGFLVGRGMPVKGDPRKGRIMALFGVKSEVTNDEVEHALGVSDATATRVMDQLEQDGLVEQVGSTGRFVTYRRK